MAWRSIHDLVLQPDELLRARQLINGLSEKALESKTASMVHFLKQNKDPAAERRDAERAEFLERFLAYKMRCADDEGDDEGGDAWKTLSSIHTETRTDSKVEVEHHWSAEQMDLYLGAKRAAGLRESGKLKSRRCPMTGSDEPHMKIWIVPERLITREQDDDEQDARAVNQ